MKDLISAAPLTDVESIEVKRLLVGKTVTVRVRGVSFRLEVGTGGPNAVACGVRAACAQVRGVSVLGLAESAFGSALRRPGSPRFRRGS